MKVSSDAADKATKKAEPAAATLPLKQLQDSIKTPSAEELTNMSADEMLTEKEPFEKKDHLCPDCEIILKELIHDFVCAEMMMKRARTWIQERLGIDPDGADAIHGRVPDNRYPTAAELKAAKKIEDRGEIASGPVVSIPVSTVVKNGDITEIKKGDLLFQSPESRAAADKYSAESTLAACGGDTAPPFSNLLASVPGITPVVLKILMANNIGTIDDYKAIPNAKHPSKSLLKDGLGKNTLTEARIKKTESAIEAYLELHKTPADKSGEKYVVGDPIIIPVVPLLEQKPLDFPQDVFEL